MALRRFSGYDAGYMKNIFSIAFEKAGNTYVPVFRTLPDAMLPAN